MLSKYSHDFCLLWPASVWPCHLCDLTSTISAHIPFNVYKVLCWFNVTAFCSDTCCWDVYFDQDLSLGLLKLFHPSILFPQPITSVQINSLFNCSQGCTAHKTLPLKCSLMNQPFTQAQTCIVITGYISSLSKVSKYPNFLADLKQI